MKRCLSDIEDELERAVFMAVYRSRIQRYRRGLALVILLLKHLLRGLLIIWPAYLVLIIVLLVPDFREYFYYFLALLPGLLVWLTIYLKGAKLDYAQHVRGQLLEKGFLKNLILN